MAKFSRLTGTTSQSVNVFIQDSSSTVGAGLSGLIFSSTGLTAYYTFAGANTTSVQITMATLATVTSAYSSGGFKEIDSTNMKGWYRFDLPNASLVSSKGNTVAVHMQGATNMAPCPFELELTSVDNQSTSYGLSLAKTTNITGFNDITAAAAATGVWQDTTSGDFTVSSSIGKSLFTSGVVPGGSGGLLISGSNSGTTTLGALTVTGATTHTGNVSMAAGLNITQSSSNTSALVITGNGTGNGAVFTSGSGATGDGVQMTAASSNGNALILTHAGTGKDLNAQTTNALQVNATAINAVATTSVTTVNANIGVTQPINFTGTAGSALVKSDMTDIAGSAVSASTAQLGVNLVNIAGAAVSTSTAQLGVNIVNVAGSANTGSAGYVGVDWGQVTNKTTTNALTGTTISTSQVVASVTGAVGSVSGNVGGNIVGSVGSVTGAVGSVTGNVGGNVTGSVGSVATAVAITSNVKKNQALSAFTFLMTDSTLHAPSTGLTVTATRSLDGGAFGACANSVTEISNGWYKIDLATTDLNANVVSLRFTAASSDDRDIQIVTQP